MTQVTFFQLDSSDTQDAVTKIVAQHYRQRHQCIVVCDAQSDAEWWDEYWWQQPADAFLPHNLRGEGPANGAPITLVWHPVNESAGVMINLSKHALAINPRYRHIIEFVPADEAGKVSARERYKEYQKAGCELQFLPITKESSNG